MKLSFNQPDPWLLFSIAINFALLIWNAGWPSQYRWANIMMVVSQAGAVTLLSYKLGNSRGLYHSERMDALMRRYNGEESYDPDAR
jgi:hypothetical protein